MNPKNGVNLTIRGHGLPITPAIRRYVESKLGCPLRHLDQSMSVNVLLTGMKKTGRGHLEGKMRKAEVTVQVKGNPLHLEHVCKDLYEAIDMLMEKLDRALMERKETFSVPEELQKLPTPNRHFFKTVIKNVGLL